MWYTIMHFLFQAIVVHIISVGGVSAGVNSLTKPGACELESRVLRSFDIAGRMTKEFTPVVDYIPS